MIAILTLIYVGLIWLLFFKLKLLPWTKISKGLVVLIGVVILTLFLVGLQGLTPASVQGGITGRIVEIAPQVSGRVITVKAEPNVTVDEGALLFSIDPVLFEAQIDELEARLELARLRLGQYQELATGRAGTEFQVQQSRAEVEQLEALLVVAQFQQKALINVKVGDRATVNFPALPGQVFDAQVVLIPGAIGNTQLFASGQIASVEQLHTTRLYPVFISLPEDFPDKLRKVGLAASVTIQTEGAGVVGIVAVTLQWVSTSLDAII